MWYDSFDALGEGTFACPSVPEKMCFLPYNDPWHCVMPAPRRRLFTHATHTLARTTRPFFWLFFTNCTQCA